MNREEEKKESTIEIIQDCVRKNLSSPSYFQRQFKKSVGLTPKKYRIDEKKK